MRHRLDRRRPVAAALLALSGVLFLALPARAADAGSVVLLPTTGIVDNVMVDNITSALNAAADARAAAVIIELDTPGGSLDSTQQIVTALLSSRVPTIVWVAPAGGYAASAGTFITLAANLAYMAPGTRIGAASPIDSSGNDIPGTLGEKVKNDTIAWVTSIAQTRHRPVAWAAATVQSASSSSANDAVTAGAVDGIAATAQDVVAQANGKTVQVAGSSVVLALAGAPIEEAVNNPLGGILRLLVDPNVAFLLFTLGALALLFELQNPNLLTGIFGVIAIALAVVGFANLPVDIAGLLLIAIGLIMFALEPAIPSHGLLTIVGVIAFVLGGSTLYTQAGQFGPAVRVAVPLLVVAAATAAAFGLLITTMAIRTRRMRGPTGSPKASVAPGTVGEVRNPLAPIGSVYAAGEEWSARTADERPLDRGTPVRVIRTDGLTVVVEPDAGALP
ncbi:MAG TPA: NfeD family protein [Candidatus Bathyarchaeia archaeon]|nr:NfeD family protein [Candidatus Bathyarchaeia archaeon]